MKLIMENWRGYIKEQSYYEELLFETFRQLEEEKGLEESAFRSLVAGLGLAVGTMFLTLQAERKGELQQAIATIQQNKAELETDETKQQELENLLMNGNAWQWAEDPSQGVGYPKIQMNEEWYTPLPPDWSIAFQVLEDKKSGIVHVPGLTAGTLPEPQEIYDTLKKEGSGEPNFTEWNKELKPYMQTTSALGGEIRGIKGQMSPPQGPELNTYQMQTVAVDPDFFDSNPDYITSTGLTARELYIKYYFGKYLGADEAVELGIKLGKDK